MGIRGEIFSDKFDTEKRTYFFNVKENRNGDRFINIVESKKHEGNFERHSIVVYNEDIDAFFDKLSKAIRNVKNKEN